MLNNNNNSFLILNKDQYKEYTKNNKIILNNCIKQKKNKIFLGIKTNLDIKNERKIINKVNFKNKSKINYFNKEYSVNPLSFNFNSRNNSNDSKFSNFSKNSSISRISSKINFKRTLDLNLNHLKSKTHIVKRDGKFIEEKIYKI